MKKSKKVGAPVYVIRKVLKTVRAELNELKAEYEDIPSARGGLQGLHINPRLNLKALPETAYVAAVLGVADERVSFPPDLP